MELNSQPPQQPIKPVVADPATTSAQSTNSVSPLAPQPKRRGWLLLLGVAVVGVTGSLFWYSRSGTVTTKPFPTPAPSGWKTYKSLQSSSSFQYPSNLVVQSSGSLDKEVAGEVIEHEQVLFPNSYLAIDFKVYDGNNKRANTYICADVILPPPLTQTLNQDANSKILEEGIVGDEGVGSSIAGFTIYLDTIANHPSISNGCSGLKHYIPLANNHFITLTAQHVLPQCIKAPCPGDELKGTMTNYVKLPEVQTAIKIFKSFRK